MNHESKSQSDSQSDSQSENKMRIGIFDSGIGGLGTFFHLKSYLPELEVYYISDLAYCPYGEKSPQEITDRCHYLTKQLLLQQVSLVTVACNTATAVSIDELRKTYPLPFVGVEPYLNFIHNAKIPINPVVLLTAASANSPRFKRLKQKLLIEDHQLTVFPCLGLAELIENHLHQKHEPFFQKRFKEILQPLLGQNYTHAILGCTHYPFMSDEISSYLNIECISPEPYVARRIKTLILDHHLQNLKDPQVPHNQNQSLKHINFQEILPQFYFYSTKEDPLIHDKIKVIQKSYR